MLRAFHLKKKKKQQLETSFAEGRYKTGPDFRRKNVQIVYFLSHMPFCHTQVSKYNKMIAW